MTFDEASAKVVALNTAAHQIATMWHPQAAGEVVVTGHSNVRVVKGDVLQYQLSTGDIVPL